MLLSIIFTCKHSLQWVIELVHSLWSLVHYHHGTLNKTPLWYPAVTPSNGDPAGIVPQDQSIPAFQEVLDGVDVRMGQAKNPNMGLGGSWACQIRPQGLPALGYGQSQLTYAHSIRTSFPCPWWGVEPALPWGQGQFSCHNVHQRAEPAQRGPRISSYTVLKTPCSNMGHKHQHSP